LTASLAASPGLGEWFITLETVAIETPASLATSLIVAIMRISHLVRVVFILTVRNISGMVMPSPVQILTIHRI
jgi:hypothetical protein